MPENDQILDEIDLAAELAKETATKPEPGEVIKPDFIESGNEDQSGTNEPGTTSTAADQENTDDFTPPSETDTITEEEETIPAEDLADLIIEGTDMLLQKTCPGIYERSLSAADRKTIMDYINAFKVAKETKRPIVITEEMQNNSAAFADYDTYCREIPFTENEKNKLRDPLKKVLAKTNFKATPEGALMYTATIILVPRILPIVQKKFS